MEITQGFNSRRFVILALTTLGFITLISLYSANASSNHKLQAAVQAASNAQTQFKLNTSQATPTTLPNLEQITTPGQSAEEPSPNLQVTVNGQPVALPGNGTTQQQVSSPNGQSASVTVTQDQSGSGNASNTSSSTTNLSITGGSSTASRSNTNISVHTSSP